ncbi:poly(ethylene terephthalate) hydrolase family protein [Paenibacillus radicis (ex Gao et al. 2016)]|uniref:Alpha/beta hydrolase n=1 Tax=Paenibacillus radicis (ex Gao et al. 2016) TaxID=1737354 RepID=A0A917GSX6_9BACL|nr:alpha/beta hydrolase [Paenibacillus radicis (ex Gao et al. 2016)]GGG56474.1 hypothetical protein GCM10010918_06810 [Paenibacillus radicis (ex Gao et al. 2016)]
MDLQLNPIPSRRKRFASWLSIRIANRLEHDSYIWRCSSAALLIFSSFLSGLAALGMPTGFGALADIGAFVLASGTALIFVSQVIAILLSLMLLPVPRLFIGFLGYTATLAYFVFFHLSFGLWPSVWMAGAYAIAGAFIGIAAGWIWRYKLRGVKWVAAATVISAITAAAILYPLGEGGAEPSTLFDADTDAADVTAAPVIGPDQLQLANPSEPGSFQYREFTYGSGDDRQRKLFRSGAELITDSVDASGYISNWPWLKQLFWGFDEEKLPVNGTVWMPEGEGQFPLVLIVHGNHLMEDFSDGGYRYLGELLASRGMIAVSVDENFLNYSAWSGIPDQDFKVRAWMLLKHLQQIQSFNEQAGNAFYGKVDLEQVALVGHSRGGQAVAMAAAKDQWFAEDKSLQSLDSIQIKSIVAMAPTDKEIDDKLAMLQDVNYLTLQGARDADVNSFYGDRQYSRTSFSQNTGVQNHFKASLYIAEANHSRFNSDWGTMDESLPGGLLLNQKGMLKAEEQRRIAKVYVSAFLETTLNGKEGYEPLFQDYRSGMDWLPASTGYVSRYEDSSFAAAATFEEHSNEPTLPAGGKLETDGMLQMSNSSSADDNSTGTKGVVIEWEDSGSLTLNLPESYSTAVAEDEQHVLTFSIANLAMELEPEHAGDASGGSTADTILPSQPNIAIEIVTTDGSSVELPLEQFMEVPSPFDSTYLTIPWLEKRIKDGKYKDSAEPVFQTYRLPLAHFAEEAGLSLSDLQVSEISFRVGEGPGKVILDDIGFSQ